jgi:hypothetical protein
MASVSGVPRGAGHEKDASPSGLDAGESDAGSADAVVLTRSCGRVPVVQTSGEDIASATSTERPADFLVARQSEAWIVDDCANPKLTLEFSDGLCPAGSGHQLSFTLDLDNLADGAIHAGNNEVLPDGDGVGIRIRYTRPSRLQPNGTWGTCAGAAGQLIFLNEPKPSAGAILDARYDMILTPCDGSDQEPQVVVGSMRVILRFGLNRFCPDRML